MTKALVLAESRDGSLRNVSFEAIAAARRVADEVIAVLIGHDVAKDADALASRGQTRCSSSRMSVFYTTRQTVTDKSSSS